MRELYKYVALTVNGEEISLYDALKPGKLSGNLQFVQDAIDAAIIRQAAHQRGIEASDDELQAAADEFRSSLELYDVAATDAWLEAKHLSFEDALEVLETRVLAGKLREALTGGDCIAQHFAEQRLSFDTAVLYRLVVEQEDVARELRAQIAEDDADFHTLARAYSIDADTRLAGGYWGSRQRDQLEPVIEAAVFGGAPGKIVGPIKTDDGWEILKIESLHHAVLDDPMREVIADQLFEEWLADQRRKARVSIPLLETLMATADEYADQIEDT